MPLQQPGVVSPTVPRADLAAHIDARGAEAEPPLLPRPRPRPPRPGLLPGPLVHVINPDGRTGGGPARGSRMCRRRCCSRRAGGVGEPHHCIQQLLVRINLAERRRQQLRLDRSVIEVVGGRRRRHAGFLSLRSVERVRWRKAHPLHVAVGVEDAMARETGTRTGRGGGRHRYRRRLALLPLPLFPPRSSRTVDPPTDPLVGVVAGPLPPPPRRRRIVPPPPLPKTTRATSASYPSSPWQRLRDSRASSSSVQSPPSSTDLIPGLLPPP